jgi:hypothetical protein
MLHLQTEFCNIMTVYEISPDIEASNPLDNSNDLQQNTDLWTNLARVMDPNDPMQKLAISRCWCNLKTHLEKSLVSSQGVMQDTHQVELATFGSVLLNSQV